MIAAFAERADTGELEGILQLSFEPLVSSDVIKSPYSAVVDAGLTTVVGGTQAKVSPGTTTNGRIRRGSSSSHSASCCRSPSLA